MPGLQHRNSFALQRHAKSTTFFEALELSRLNTGLLIQGSQIWVRLEAEIFPNMNKVPLHKPFIITLKLSWKNWNTVEKDVKMQVIHASIILLEYIPFGKGFVVKETNRLPQNTMARLFKPSLA